MSKVRTADRPAAAGSETNYAESTCLTLSSGFRYESEAGESEKESRKIASGEVYGNFGDFGEFEVVGEVGG